MKKVLLVSHSQKIGGAERCLAELAGGLVKKGYEVYVTLPSKGENYDMFHSLNVQILIFGYPWWLNFKNEKYTATDKLKKFRSQVYAIIRFFTVIMKVKPDMVLTNTIAMPFAAIASKISGKKHVWFIHELGEEDHGLLFDYGIGASMKLASFTSQRILVNSILVKEKFSKYISADKMDIVNYDIPMPPSSCDEHAKYEGNELNLYLIGQIQKGKGQLIAIKAHKQLLGKGVHSKLHILGSVSDVNYFEEIQLYIKDNNIKDVFFHGFKEKPYLNLLPNPIGLMCSEFEALGRVTIEYMKLGVPVIANTAGQLVNIIDDGKNGLLFKKNDAIDLADKVMMLLESKDLRADIIVDAKKYANINYNSELYINGVLKAFGE